MTERRPLAHSTRPVAAILLLGLVLTALGTWAAARADSNTEQRLLETQTRQAASVLSTAVAAIQQPLTAALQVQTQLPPEQGANAFEQLFTDFVGPEATFASASLWRRENRGFGQVETVGAEPELDPDSPELEALLDRALGATTTVVTSVESDDRLTIAYAKADPDTGFVVYAERPIPQDRRAPVDSDSAYSGLHYAIYLGPGTDTAQMTTTDVAPADLPLEGRTSQTSVPFGDTVLTVVTSPRGHLGSSLSQRLPWILLASGLILSGAVALVARQLVRSRQQAVSATETISGLYEQVDAVYAEQGTTFLRLQRALLPRVAPDIPGIEVATEYVAAAQNADIGGDWYSAIGLEEDTFGFVVGDVSGHGVDAVAEMARARFTLRAYLLDGATPEAALEKCSQQFDITKDDHLVTALVGVGNWRTGDITVANAGHPPPLLVGHAGAEFVDIPVGPPLGTGPTTYRSQSFVLPVGSALVAYTDGLIERRGEPIDDGMRRLAEGLSVAEAGQLDAMIAEILAKMHSTERADDVAVLALRRLPSVTKSFDANARAPRAARSYVGELLSAHDVGEDVSQDVVLAVSELVTNAVNSGATQVEVDLAWSAGRLDLSVWDDGGGWPTRLDATDDSTGGRGLAIVDHLSESWDVTPLPEGKRVSARWSLPDAEPAQPSRP